MSNSYLQGNIVNPRESPRDRRVAKTQASHYSSGKEDGKHYNLVDKADESKYQVLDEEGLYDEAKKTADLRQSIELMTGDGPSKAPDGMAKSVKVGTGTKEMQIQRRKLHELDATMGAESKSIQAIRSGRPSPRGSAAKGGPPSPGAKRSYRSPNRESKEIAPGKGKGTGKSSSEAYQKTMGDLGAELGAKPGPGDQGAIPPAEAKEDSAENKEKEKKKHKMISKAEAVQLYEANLKMKKEEERAYMAEQAERFHRASKSGKTFDTMLKRAARAHEKNVAKAAAKQAAEEEQRRKDEEERENARKAHLNKPLSTVGEMSWREMQEQQENARKEAAEKRKQELAASSKAPAGAFANAADSKHRQAAKEAEAAAAAGAFTFKATDPDRVTAKLEKQHAVWLRTLEESKRRANEKLAERHLASLGAGGKDPSAAMEARAEVLASKRAARIAEKEQKERMLREKEQEKERKHQEKLFNQKVPESGRRLTRSAQNRAEIVRRALEEAEEKKKEEEKKKKIQEKKDREMGLMLKYLVDERDRERKENVAGGFREISDAQIAEHTKAAKAEYSARMAENKKRLESVVNNRPSLMERHEQAIAAKTANTKALGTVAQAVGGGGFELFNEDEAMKLGVLGGGDD